LSIESRPDNPSGCGLAGCRDEQVFFDLPVVPIGKPPRGSAVNINQRNLIEPWHVRGSSTTAFYTGDSLVPLSNIVRCDYRIFALSLPERGLRDAAKWLSASAARHQRGASMMVTNGTAMKQTKSNSLRRSRASGCGLQRRTRRASSPSNGYGLVAAGTADSTAARRLLDFDPASLLTRSK